ncbi:acyl-CoA dehydrogenase family protein [Granulicoccus phenolivorans]|uniref:acyl-CoA dehydrogenase family protein n=1 Tax=Granulicoccus phenolivorans TaxID=266854 RepID=UPI00040682D9|nr:acyl-CoA dehydrogenase family protein [Granulicoccus phenolivorans]
MDINFTPEETAFRDEVRAFLHAELPTRLSTKVAQGLELSKQDQLEWHAILNKRGWLAAGWPTEYGGPGWNPVQRYLFDAECALADAPTVLPFGISMLAPVLIRFGTDEQRAHWLPRMLDGTDWWCQGYSEPGAGSDLAALRTTAVRDGDHYIVNGQKTWTTGAHHANMIFCLVRTDPSAKKQQGISFLLIDLNSPGVEIRPIRTLDGAHEVNEVFLSDVRVPVANLVGTENRGWDCAKFLLTHERTTAARVSNAIAELRRVKESAARAQRNGRRLAEDPVFAARVARVEIEIANLQTTSLMILRSASDGRAPGPESSLLKLRGSQIRQEISALLRRASGVHARTYDPEQLCADSFAEMTVPEPRGLTATAQYLNKRKLSIYGGASEIQRTIIAKSVLGL